jgi:hypothetical protein
VNYYNTTAGHPYYGAGDPILNFPHNHVLRANPDGPHGRSAVIPANVSPGGVYSYTWNYTLPAGWDDTKIHVIGFVYNYKATLTDGQVYDAAESVLGTPLGTSTPNQDAFSVIAYPNPVNSMGNVEINMPKASPATVEIFNLMGQREAVLFEGNLAAGTHNMSYDVTDVANGVYLMVVTTPEGKAEKKIVVTH